MSKHLISDYEKTLARAVASDIDTVNWLVVGKLADGRELCLVFGWVEDYEPDENLYQQTLEHGGQFTYTLCAKLAVNVDDLQCDYDIDWLQPYRKDGEVWDTETAITKGEYDFDWYKAEAKAIIEAIDKGDFEV